MNLESIPQAVLHRCQAILLTQNADGAIATASGPVEEWTGCTGAKWQLDPETCWACVHEADVPLLRAAFANASAELLTRFRLRHAKSGQIRWVQRHHWQGTARKGETAQWHSLWQDITAQVQLELALADSAWPQTLARLSGNIAHDFNNVLTGVLSLSDAWLTMTPPGDPVKEALGIINKNAVRGTQLIRAWTQLQNAPSDNRTYLDIGQALRDWAEDMRQVFSRRTDVKVTVESEKPLAVFVEPLELRQVLLSAVVERADFGKQTSVLLDATLHRQVDCQIGSVPRLPAVCIVLNVDPVSRSGLSTGPDHAYTLNLRRFLQRNGGGLTQERLGTSGQIIRLWLPQADFTEGLQLPARKRRSILILGSSSEMETFMSAWPPQAAFLTFANPETVPGKQWWNFELEALVLPGSLSEETGDLWLAWARAQQSALKTIVYWNSSDPLAIPPEYTKRADLLIHSQDPAERTWPRIQKLWSETVTGS